MGVDVVEDVGGAWVAVAGLADGAGVDEVFGVGLDLVGFAGGDVFDFGGLDVGARDVGVAVEADLGELVGEVRHGVEAVGDVVPVGGLVEGGVDDGEVVDLTDHSDAA